MSNPSGVTSFSWIMSIDLSYQMKEYSVKNLLYLPTHTQHNPIFSIRSY